MEQSVYFNASNDRCSSGRSNSSRCLHLGFLVVACASVAPFESAQAYDFYGRGPESVVIQTATSRLFADDPDNAGSWRDITGNLYEGSGFVPGREVTNRIRNVTASTHYISAVRADGASYVCRQPCRGVWENRGSTVPIIVRADAYLAGMYSARSEGLTWTVTWIDRFGESNAISVDIGTVRVTEPPRMVHVQGGSKYIVAAFSYGPSKTSEVHTWQREDDGRFTYVGPNFVRLGLGTITSMSMYSGSLYAAIAGRGLIFTQLGSSNFERVGTMTPRRHAVGRRWLYRITPGGRFVKSFRPCASSCPTIQVPLPDGETPFSITSY
jgi:hypothetical protein